MRQSSILHVTGEIVSIVLLALTGRFIAFAQTTLDAGAPLTIDAVLNHFARLLSVVRNSQPEEQRQLMRLCARSTSASAACA
jgi:hypothetical protein